MKTLHGPPRNEQRIATGWRMQIDQLTRDADMLALRGRLTVEEKLASLEKAHARALKTLERCGKELGAGGDAILDNLGDIWDEISATATALRDEMAEAVHRQEYERGRRAGTGERQEAQ